MIIFASMVSPFKCFSPKRSNKHHWSNVQISLCYNNKSHFHYSNNCSNSTWCNPLIFFTLEAHKKQIKQREADVKIPLTSDLKHSHMASHERPHKCSCAFTYGSQQRRWESIQPWLLPAHSWNHQPRGSDGAKRHGDQELLSVRLRLNSLPRLASPLDKNQEKKSILMFAI